MAIYHLPVKMIKRSAGQSAVASAAYRRATLLIDKRTGLVHNFSHKTNVIYSEIFAPDNAPAWMMEICGLQKTDPSLAAEVLWNSVEKREKRVDAQLAREFEFALPLELNQNECIALTKAYVKTLTDQGMVVDVSIHWDKGNPHAHVMASTRFLETQGWGKKNCEWNKKSALKGWRENLATLSNQFLEKNGFYQRISHLSYAAQGIDLEPTVHEGSANSRANKNARAENKKIRLHNLNKIIENPTILLEKLALQNTTLSIADITTALGFYLAPANTESSDSNSPKPKSGRLPFQTLNIIQAAVAPQFFAASNPANANVAMLQNAAIDSMIMIPPAIPISPSATVNVDDPIAMTLKVLKEINRTESVFTEQMLKHVLAKLLSQPETAAKALAQIKASPELMAIGLGEDGRERYTTRQMFDLENELQELSVKLSQKYTHKVSGRTIKDCIQKFNLKDSQEDAIKHILKGNALSIMVGRAGTGKSYSLKAAKEAWEMSGYRVYGIALAGIASDNLSLDSDIESRTIESFSYAINERKLRLTSKDVVVMDEAGMTDIISMFKVLVEVAKAGAKLVLVGDPDQLQPVGPGAIFRAFLERIGFTELYTIQRQVEAWQRGATTHFAAGRTQKAITYYEEHNCVSFTDTPALSMEALIQDWAASLKTSTLPDNLILAYQRADVEALNKLAREELVSQKVLLNSATTRNETDQIKISIGERILFLENSWRYGVKNGQRATIVEIETDRQKNVIAIKALLDGKKKKVVRFEPKRYKKFTYGYAVTVHRAQGVTINHAFVLALGRWTKNLCYVAMTRHRHTAHLYGNKETHQSLEGLKKDLSRWGIKDSVLDYPLAFAARRGIDIESISVRFQKHVVSKLKEAAQNLKNNFEQTFSPKTFEAKQKLAHDKEQTIQDTLKRREDAIQVYFYVQAKKAVGEAWEALTAVKKTLGIDENTPPKDVEHLLKDNPALKNLREATAKRDEMAAKLYSEHALYTKALDIHAIPLEKLEKQSQMHGMRVQVAQYLLEVKQGRIVHRDKLAHLVYQNIKAYYPLLKESAVSVAHLKVEALAHQRRDILRKCTLTEREDFKKVEAYIQQCQISFKLWNQIREKENTLKNASFIPVNDLTPYQITRLQALAKTGTPLSRELLMEAQTSNQKRDELAFELHQDLDRYKTGLDFYNFGTLKSVNNPTNEFDLKAMQYAKERLERLEKQSLAFQKKKANGEFIQNYQTLLKSQDESRHQIADAIIQNKKSYYNAIFELEEPLVLLKAIHQDAKLYQRAELLKGFSAEEQEAYLTVERYVQEKRTAGKIWFENKEASNPSHPIFKEISKPHEILRDVFANAIYTSQDKYHKALEGFGIEAPSLQKASERFELRQRVTQYASMDATGENSERDALAATIYDAITTHYFALIEQKVSTNELKIHAKGHERYHLLSTCSEQEQLRFKLVEEYMQLSQESGKLWKQIQQNEKALKALPLTLKDGLSLYEIARLETFFKEGDPLCRQLLMKSRAVSEQRDLLASQIYENLSEHELGLQFFEVGYYTAKNDPPSDFDNKATGWAKNRLERLEKEAIRYNQNQEKKALINEYRSLLIQDDKNRFKIASIITLDKKKYYPVIFELTKEPLMFLRTLNQDARLHQRALFLKQASQEALDAFLTIECYWEEKKTVDKIWFENKDSAVQDNPVVKALTNKHLVLRDKLADAIYANPEHYKTALSFFKIDVDSLSKKAFYHQIRGYVAEFKISIGNLTKRMAIARKIVANRSAYVVVKEDPAVNWHRLQCYADYAIKVERFASLSPEARADYETVLAYKKSRREAGKYWGEIFRLKREDQPIPEGLFEKAIEINAKRNQLAFNIEAKREAFNDFLCSANVPTKDITKHAEAHNNNILKQTQRVESQKNQAIPDLPVPQKSVSVQTKELNFTKEPAKSYWDLNMVNAALASRASEFTEYLLGTLIARASNATTYRYGKKKGSLQVTVQGAKAGLWYDFATQEGGTLLSLLMRERELDFTEALQYAAEWAGIAPESKTFKPTQNREPEFSFIKEELTPKQLKNIQYAKDIVANSIPIKGTLAERYLKEHRGITESALDTSFRFNPGVFEPITQKNCPALVVIAKNEKQEVQSVQCIYLDLKTANKLDIDIPKRTFGPQAGASVLVQRGNGSSHQFAVAEGPETALSVAQSDKSMSVWCSLGVSNFGKMPIPTGSSKLLICADNDGAEASSQISLIKSIKMLSERGINVWYTRPQDCEDFNDVLKKHGANYLKKLLDAKIQVKKAMTLEQVMESKELVSDSGRLVAEFTKQFKKYKKMAEPKSTDEAQKKMALFEQVGKVAAFIYGDAIFKEAAKRHGIDSEVSYAARTYIKHQVWRMQASHLREQIKSADPIKDYLEAVEQKTKLTPLWKSPSLAEKEQWHTLNEKMKTLAFVIDKDPLLQHTAKEKGIYAAVQKGAFEVQEKIAHQHSLEEELGMER